MRHFRLGFLIYAVLVWTTTVVGQEASGSDPQATAILQQSLAAQTGGAPITDVTLTGSARRIAGSDDETGTATLKATAAGDSRVDLRFPSGNRLEIRNHAALPLPGSLPPGVPASVAQTAQPVGAWSGPDGVLHATAGQNLMNDATWFLPSSTLGKLVSAPPQVWLLSYVGSETRDGQSVVHVSASLSVAPSSNTPPRIASLIQHLSQMDIFLDSGTLLPVALTFNTHPDNDALVDIPAEIHFSDYRPMSGVRVPFRVQKYLNNGLVLDLQFANVSVNSGLSAAAFDIQ